MAVPDARTAYLAHVHGAPCFTVEDVTIDDVRAGFKWGSTSWKQHTWQKVGIVRSIHRLGFNVVHSDIDVVWFRDPLSYFMQRFTVPDYMVSMAPITTLNALGDDGLETGVSVGHYMNTGVYFLRATPGGSILINTWDSLRTRPEMQQYHDQDGLYKHLQKQKNELYDYNGRFATVLNGTKLAQLPATLFQNSYSNTVNRLHEVHKVKPYEAHMVWTYGNNYGKMHRMREHMYFHDPAEWYNEGLYLTVDLTPVVVPQGYNEWNDTVAMVNEHRKAMKSQLTELYYAFALAYTSSRILVLPRMTCFCIQNWFESPLCRLPGETVTKLPMICPADYLFQMDKLYHMMVNMRRIQFREYSWLDNPRTHAKFKAKPFEVQAGDVLHPKHDTPGKLHTLPYSFKDFELASELNRLQVEPVVHIRNPMKLFKSFTYPHIQQEFDKVMSELGVRWCCHTDIDLKSGHAKAGGFNENGFMLRVESLKVAA